MKAVDIISGLSIIEKARPNQNKDSYHVRAEHDTIYAGSLEWPISEEDKASLIEMGWQEDEDVDGWVCYV